MFNKKCKIFSCSGVWIKVIGIRISIDNVSMVIKMCFGLILFFSLFNWGVLISVVILGIEVIMLLIKVRLWMFLVSLCIYSVKMGVIELVVIWMIMVVINRLRINLGFFNELNICCLLSMFFFNIGVNCFLI